MKPSKTRLVLRLTLTLALLIAVLAPALAVAMPVQAQNTGLTINLRRDFGYGLGSQIQGRFTLSASGPSDLGSVVFQLDGQEIGRADKAPFQMAINTDNYPLGRHIFTATGTTEGGRTLTSNQISVEMVSGDQASRLLVWVGAGVLGIIVLVFVLQFVLARRLAGRHLDPSAPRHYGLAGGAICPKCGRPLALSQLGINVLTGKLQPCPYCGKWSIMRRASNQQLAAAEAAERQAAGPAVATVSAEERLRRQIEESKYQ